MASQLGLPLVPDTSYYYPRFCLGLPEGEKRELGEIISCDLCFDGRYYAVSGKCLVDREDFICYDVVTRTSLSLGDRVTYEGRELLVSRKKTELAGGEVIFTYRLAGNSYGFAPVTGCIRTNGSTCEGTTIESNGGLVLMAKEGIRLESMAGIAMQGMSDIMALYAEGASSLCVNGSVDMLGRLAGISASKYTGYPPYDDAPKEGEFDWDGFTRNLAIGLGVVAVCAIGAAISIATLGAGSILAGAFIGAGIGALSTTAMKAGEEISTGNVRSAKEAFRDVGISAASGFITGAFGAKFPGAHRLTEGVVDTAVSAGERLAYAVFDDSMSWDEKWAYAFDPGQMVADFVTGVVIGEILDGIMAATQNKLRSIFANNDAAMREAIESGEDVLDEIKRIDEIEVEFNYNSKFDEAEFARQLADQQKGMNELTVREYLDNRQKYIEQGRAIESNAAQQAAREKAFVDKVDELQDAGLSLKEAEEQAEKWLDTQAALHNPDQVAGGYASNVGGVGDKGVNSSIGSQWRYRIDGVDAQIKKMAESMSEAEKNSTYLNVKLAHKGD